MFAHPIGVVCTHSAAPIAHLGQNPTFGALYILYIDGPYFPLRALLSVLEISELGDECEVGLRAILEGLSTNIGRELQDMESMESM